MSHPKQPIPGEIKTTSPTTQEWFLKKRLLLSLSLLLILVVVFYDVSYNEIANPSQSPDHPISNFLKNAAAKLAVDSVPHFNGVYLIRMALLIIASFLIVFSITHFQRRNSDGSKTNQENLGDGTIQSIIPSRQQNLIIKLFLFISVIALSLFLKSPGRFAVICREGSLIDASSALTHFINCGLFIYIAVLLNRKLTSKNKLYLFVPIVFAFAFFLSTMEEISWGQSIFHWRTPKGFEENIQHETNLHNFFTDPLEAVYYFGSFVLLIFIPFVNDRTSLLSQQKFFSLFTPSRFILFLSVIFVAYEYEMWNEVLTQLSFFITLFILLHYLLFYKRTGKNISNITLILVVFIATQVLFIAFGHRQKRSWDISEYKELFIPLSFLIYSIEVLLKVKRQSRS